MFILYTGHVLECLIGNVTEAFRKEEENKVGDKVCSLLEHLQLSSMYSIVFFSAIGEILIDGIYQAEES